MAKKHKTFIKFVLVAAILGLIGPTIAGLVSGLSGMLNFGWFALGSWIVTGLVILGSIWLLEKAKYFKN